MGLKGLRGLLVLAVLTTAAACLAPDSAMAQQRMGMTSGDLFYNYYQPPDPYWGLGAQLYVAPRPTPPYVGHTFITYQPMMPHEFLYQHHRVYYRNNPDGTTTQTRVRWAYTWPNWPLVCEWKYHDEPRLPLQGMLPGR